jgi:hypothetical protein
LAGSCEISALDAALVASENGVAGAEQMKDAGEMVKNLAEDLRQKALFNESQRTYNALEWKAVAFEQKRIADELDAIVTRLAGEGKQHD